MKAKKSFLKADEIVFSRYIERIYPSKGKLKQLLLSGEKIDIYIGIDPTGSDLHLGHSTNFLLLKKFQAMGHRVILLIGDFTARIGDPTGKPGARKALSREEVLKNCKDYKKQVSKILDFKGGKSPVIIRFNSRWLSGLKLEQLVELMAKSTVGQMVKRDMFRKRIKEKKEIYLNEFLYPLLQGYDSVAMRVDIELGGNDQTFNMMMGRALMKDYLKKEKIVIATKLLVNPKTQKKLMSKSEGIFISLKAKADQMYGQVMALSDEVIPGVLELCTEVPDKEIKEMEKALAQKTISRKDLKMKLAKEIVAIYHGKEESKKAEKAFDRVFREKKNPLKMEKLKIKDGKINIIELILRTKKASSKSEAKRLILQKAVSINNILKEDWKETVEIEKGTVIKVGKKKFFEIS